LKQAARKLEGYIGEQPTEKQIGALLGTPKQGEFVNLLE
jgi:hypothetical protein